MLVLGLKICVKKKSVKDPSGEYGSFQGRMLEEIAIGISGNV